MPNATHGGSIHEDNLMMGEFATSLDYVTDQDGHIVMLYQIGLSEVSRMIDMYDNGEF